MKKVTLTITIAFSLGFLFTSSAMTILPFHLNEVVSKVSREVSLEKEIHLQNWMLTPERFQRAAEYENEKAIEVSSWMLQGNWLKDNPEDEASIEVEDWMLSGFNQSEERIVLEDWMLSTASQSDRAIAVEY